MTRQRFDALAGYIRHPITAALAEELEWYSHSDPRVLGVLIRDRTDNDFSGIILGPDQRRRYRAVWMVPVCDDVDAARVRLLQLMEDWSRRPDEDFHQGDEQGPATDFFTPVVPSARLNPAFVRVATEEGFSAARQLMAAMMHYYEDIDGNFVEQFQSDGFDARFWELYMFALLTEAGLVFDRSYNAPDFLCEGWPGRIFFEAVTVNPTRSGNLITEPPVPSEKDEVLAYLKNYMPIKWGGALTAKLRKQYWDLPHVGDRPIVLAVQDFHVLRSMTFTQSTLAPYLYGVEFSAYYNAGGELQIKTDRIQTHKWGEKTIESGFFWLDGAERISAVIQNPTATISKFNRMGRLAAFGSDAVRMWKFGLAYNPDPQAATALRYRQNVNDPIFSERWAEGLNVFHNPRALHPLDPEIFPNAMHHTYEGDSITHTVPEFHPLTAETIILSPRRPKQRDRIG